MANKILLARFALNMDALKTMHVATMDFPYENALDTFMGDMIAINQARDAVAYEEYPPIRRLNDVLVGTAPVLVHGFETHGRKRPWLQSGINTKPRRMLALANDADDHPVWRPDSDQINDLAAVWATQWALATFSDEIAMRGGEEAVEALDENIRAAQPVWQEQTLADLWDQRETNNAVWSALPSVLAATFTSRMQDRSFAMGNEHIQRALRWQLTQDGDRLLCVVSEPFHYESGSNRDLISYKLEFRLQTQAGGKAPWVAVYMRMRRWADRPVSRTNFGRDVSVLVTLGSSRKPGWQTQPTMVRLQVQGGANNLSWKNDTPLLLEAWKARPLVNPNALFADPQNYARPDDHGDSYYILHAEGMKYDTPKNHTAKTGTSLRERSEIMDHIAAVMGNYQRDAESDPLMSLLTPDTDLDVDFRSILAPEDIYAKQLRAMYTTRDIDQASALPRTTLPPPNVDRERIPERRLRLQRHLIGAALDRARHGKRLNIMLVTKEKPAKVVLEREIRRLLYLDAESPLPSSVVITPVVIPAALSVPPGKSIPYARKAADREVHQATLTAEWQQLVNEWEQLLKKHALSEAYNLALIEIDGSSNPSDNSREKSGWHKSAVRHACVQTSVVSQMLRTIPPAMADPKYFAPFVPTELGRIKNAVRDLLLRQLHVLYDLPQALYAHAGLSEDNASNLTVVGLYRYRASIPNQVDYPLAVEFRPDGTVMVILPDAEGNPQEPMPYVEAGIQIGRVFAQPMNKENKRQVNYYPRDNDPRLTRFAEAVLTRVRQKPTLILMEADGWRSHGVLPIGNEVLQHNRLQINNRTYAPESLPYVRMVRVRDAGNLGETPQYAATNNTTWNELDAAELFDMMIGVIDTHTTSDLPHYFSIGRQLAAAKNDDHTLYSFDEGGDVAYKHQQAVEMVPFFTQPADEDPYVYCRIAHLLRSTSAWEGGNIVLAFPLHLARTLVKDQLDVFKPWV